MKMIDKWDKNLEMNLTPYQKLFFMDMENYLNEKLYFYGSVIRNDYFKNKSDIDVSIFTDNLQLLKLKLQHFLKIENPKNFKNVFWMLKDSKRLAKGYKIFYKNDKIITEISFYENDFKYEILNDHYSKSLIPIYALILLIILKYLFYNFYFISKKQYNIIKKMIFSNFVGRKEKDDFITI